MPVVLNILGLLDGPRDRPPQLSEFRAVFASRQSWIIMGMIFLTTDSSGPICLDHDHIWIRGNFYNDVHSSARSIPSHTFKWHEGRDFCITASSDNLKIKLFSFLPAYLWWSLFPLCWTHINWTSDSTREVWRVGRRHLSSDLMSWLDLLSPMYSYMPQVRPMSPCQPVNLDLATSSTYLLWCESGNSNSYSF